MGKTILVGVAVWVAAVIVFALVLPDQSEVGAVAAFLIAVMWAILWHRRRSQQRRTVDSNGRHGT